MISRRDSQRVIPFIFVVGKKNRKYLSFELDISGKGQSNPDANVEAWIIDSHDL